MGYISLFYFFLVIVLLFVYYSAATNYRWVVLLIGSILFYVHLCKENSIVLFCSIIISYLSGKKLYALHEKQRRTIAEIMYLLSLTAILLPLVWVKWVGFWGIGYEGSVSGVLITSIGLSFFSLTQVAYVTDVYFGRITPEKNLLKYTLFVSFFPHIIQGPIPRFHSLQSDLVKGHRFLAQNIMNGVLLISYGLFLKFVIADRAGIIVDHVFENYEVYKGSFVLCAGILYSIQLYTDFMSCVKISQGVSFLFGIKLGENFDYPYLSTSIKEFWRKWHISLSSWFRDYIYIPLGGNRKGKVKKELYLLLVFLISGLWHGNGMNFLVWGLLHGVYQITEDLLTPLRNRVLNAFGMFEGTFIRNLLLTIWTCFRVMIAWIIFRASSARQGIKMVLSIFSVYNPWILSDGSLQTLGLDYREWMVLNLSILMLIVIGLLQKRISVRSWILKQHILVRWSVCFLLLAGAMVYGSYGIGFEARAFIYGGF